MKHYLIKLRPLDKFFFGTGKEFGIDNQEYFIESGYLPQQTSLLGMLRYELLKNADKSIFENNKIKDDYKAKELIGEKSFVANANENNFGKIQSISSLFLMKEDIKLFPQSKEYQKDDKGKIEFLDFTFEDDLPNLKGYNPKNGIENIWSDEQGNTFSYDKIFTPQNQTGIRIPNRDKQKEKEENKAFYVQTFHKMKQNFYFAFYATLDDEIILNNSTVILGGERQLFSMEVAPVDAISYAEKYAVSSVNKAVLLSDAYIQKDLNSICDFAITDVVNFRCLQASMSTKRYYSILQKNENIERYKKENLHKSAELQLYTKGSVFYFLSKEIQDAFAKALDNPSFKTIGYNNYKIIKNK